MEDLKKHYNELIKRHRNAEAYLNNERNRIEIVLQYVDDYKKLVESIEGVLLRMKLKGYEPTPDEILNGFDEKESDKFEQIPIIRGA